MGLKVAWIAVRNKPLDQVVSDLDLARTGEHEELAEAEYSTVTMPSGWVVIINCFAAGDFILSKPLGRVKTGAEMLTCYHHEGTMMSQLAAFQGGLEIWSVTHDCEKGRDDLQVVGEPPEPFAAIRADLMTQQRSAADNCDYFFDLPKQLGKAITGFCADEDLDGLGPTPFELLEPAHVVPATRKRWW